ncbi:MAG: hypothetical protein ACI9XB_002457, partial [Gammaproteobacteria bacterium]
GFAMSVIAEDNGLFIYHCDHFSISTFLDIV